MSLIPSATKSFGYPIMLILILLSVAVTEPLSAQEHMANLGTRHFEMSMEMTPTADGNFVTVGPVVRNNSLVGGSAVKIYLNKIDEDSQVIWSRRIAESPDGQHVPLSVVEVTDPNGSAAGYAITGFDLSLGMSEPIFVVTTDLNGHITNFRRFGGALPIPGSNLAPIAGVGNKIIQNQQGELVIIGSLLLTDQLGVVPFLLNVGTNLSLNFMRIYHDSRYLQQGFGIGSLAHFDDIAVAPAIQDPETGQFAPNGYLITGGTLQSGSSISAETFVLRTDLGGNPVVAVAYGPLAGESAYSRGRALEYTSLGLVKVVSHYFVPTGAPVSTQIFTLNPGNLVLLQQDHYHDFISLGDIRETVNGEFILAGRDVASTDGAVLRLRNDGRAPFYRGYGSANVELLTDVHELHDGTLYSSGVTTTWCRGSADQYLVRSRPDGDIPDCPFTHPGLLKTNPQNPARVIEWVMESLIGNSTSEAEDVVPNTIAKVICPAPFMIPVPWDWFIRSDFTRDLQVNVGDAIASLSRLFSGGPDSVPIEAADANNDGNHDLGDVIHTLSYLFASGPAPSAPFEQIGPAPEAEEPNLFSTEEFFTYFGLNLRFGETEANLNFDLGTN